MPIQFGKQVKKIVTLSLWVCLTSTSLLADQVTEGREAEEIVRRGDVLFSDAEVSDWYIWRHFLVEHDRRLYACVQVLVDQVLWQCTLDENE